MKTCTALTTVSLVNRSAGAAVACALLCLCAAPVALAQSQPAGQASAVSSAQGMHRPQPTDGNINRPTATSRTAILPWGAAQDGLTPTVSGGSYALLTQLQQQDVLLNAELKIKRKEEELARLNKRASAGSVDSDGGSGASSLAALAAIGGQPRVLLVEGKPGAVRAMISLPSGGTVLVKPGDYVPQVGTVVSISTNTVMVRTVGNKLTAVPFWSSLDASMSSQQPASTAFPPPIPGHAPTTLAPQQTNPGPSMGSMGPPNGGP